MRHVPIDFEVHEMGSHGGRLHSRCAHLKSRSPSTIDIQEVIINASTVGFRAMAKRARDSLPQQR